MYVEDGELVKRLSLGFSASAEDGGRRFRIVSALVVPRKSVKS
jgi:hypothetical protein